jgi:hypothetical protein
MNKTVLLWAAIASLLAIRSFARPSYALGLYMLTFFAAPRIWWWGDVIEAYRWNFYAGVLLLVTVIASSADVARKRESPLATNAAMVLALMAVNAVLVHLVLAVNATSSLGWLILRLKFILLFFLIQYTIRDKKDYGIFAMSIALGMAYIGYEATINERGSFNGGRLEGIGAAGVTDANQLASLLITGLPLAATVLFTATSRWTKGLTILCCALTFNVVLMCNSRGAFLGVLLSGIVFMLMASGPARKRAMSLVAVALLGTFLLLGDPEIVTRFMTTFTEEGQRDASAQNRIVFWTAASRMIADYPLGSGGNSFSEGRGWRYMRGDGGDEGNTRAIHNGFITETVDWGVQGFTLMMLFIGVVCRTIWSGRNVALEAGDANGVIVFACIGAALVAWLVSGIFGDYLNDEWGFWTAAAVYAYLRVHTLAATTLDVSAGEDICAPPAAPLSTVLTRNS